MGTRSLTNIHSYGEDSPLLCCIYQQFDGYPEGVGAELYDLLRHAEIVNGYNSDHVVPYAFNGMGCLAAWLIARRKKDIGNVYLFPPGGGLHGAEFIYELWEASGKVMLRVIDVGYDFVSGEMKYYEPHRELFCGPISEFRVDAILGLYNDDGDCSAPEYDLPGTP